MLVQPVVSHLGLAGSSAYLDAYVNATDRRATQSLAGRSSGTVIRYDRFGRQASAPVRVGPGRDDLGRARRLHDGDEPMNAAHVTINDVARAAGVSKGLVSLALNDRRGVAPDTRDRILGSRRDLGWRPEPERPRAHHPPRRTRSG